MKSIMTISKNNLKRVIEEDNIKKLERIFVSPDFKINEKYYFFISHTLNSCLNHMSLNSCPYSTHKYM